MPTVQVIGSAFVALLVVVITHLFTRYRDRRNRLQAQRIEYLTDVYRVLCKANNHPRLYELSDELQQAVADVQLFGTLEQVRLIQQLATDLASTQTASLDGLLRELRRDLRSELGVSSLGDDRQVWLRVERNATEHEVKVSRR